MPLRGALDFAVLLTRLFLSHTPQGGGFGMAYGLLPLTLQCVSLPSQSAVLPALFAA